MVLSVVEDPDTGTFPCVFGAIFDYCLEAAALGNVNCDGSAKLFSEHEKLWFAAEEVGRVHVAAVLLHVPLDDFSLLKCITLLVADDVHGRLAQRISILSLERSGERPAFNVSKRLGNSTEHAAPIALDRVYPQHLHRMIVRDDMGMTRRACATRQWQ